MPKVGHLGLAMLSGCLAEQASRSRHYSTSSIIHRIVSIIVTIITIIVTIITIINIIRSDKSSR